MPERPIEIRVQVLDWDDLINAVEAPSTDLEESPDPLWIAVDEILKGVPIAKN